MCKVLFRYTCMFLFKNPEESWRLSLNCAGPMKFLRNLGNDT